jgi:hypothetical protein
MDERRRGLTRCPRSPPSVAGGLRREPSVAKTIIATQPGLQTAFLQTPRTSVFRRRRRRQYGRTDPRTVAPCAGLQRRILLAHHSPDRQSRRVVGRKPELLSAVRWYIAPPLPRMALAALREDQVFSAAAQLDGIPAEGAQIALICFDELTHFTAHQFFFLVSRNRSTGGCDLTSEPPAPPI